MPLLGGKGGDGFDNNVPLFIAWDSSAGKEKATFNLTLLYNALRGQSSSKIRTELSLKSFKQII